MFSPTIESRLAHRERPPRGHVMYQRWSRLLFAHWPVEPERIQRTLPHGLFADSFENRCYLGVVPFFMERIRPRFLPPVPGISWFLELNLRTYVHDAEGRAGVWFYSLDAGQSLAVALGRGLFHLPYFRADMTAAMEGGKLVYESGRRGTAAHAHDRVSYAPPVGPWLTAKPGSWEFFLLERYLLFAHERRRGRLVSGQVHHPPYPFAPVAIGSFDADFTPAFTAAGFGPPNGAPCSLLYSPGVNVRIFSTNSSDY